MKNLKEQLIEISESKGVCDAIEFAYSQQKNHISLVSKPILGANHTSEEVVTYAKNLQDYEQEVIRIRDINRKIEKENREIVSIIEDFIRDASDLNSIPEQYRAKVYSLAYSKGHALGLFEVYQELLDLVEIFN